MIARDEDGSCMVAAIGNVKLLAMATTLGYLSSLSAGVEGWIALK